MINTRPPERQTIYFESSHKKKCFIFERPTATPTPTHTTNNAKTLTGTGGTDVIAELIGATRVLGYPTLDPGPCSCCARPSCWSDSPRKRKEKRSKSTNKLELELLLLVRVEAWRYTKKKPLPAMIHFPLISQFLQSARKSVSASHQGAAFGRL